MANYKKIEVTHVKQEDSKTMCWAACSEMIAKANGKSVTQKDFIEELAKLTGDPPKSQAQCAEVNHVLKKLVSKTEFHYKEYLRDKTGKPSFADLQSRIDAGVLTIVALKNHAMLIIGYDKSGDKEIILLDDPDKEARDQPVKMEAKTLIDNMDWLVLNQSPGPK